MYKIKQKPEDFYVKEITSIEAGDKGEYSYFILKKRNYTTIRALQHIAESLGMPLKRFGFAGTKDKNAETDQSASVKGICKEKLEKIKLKDISIEYLGRGDRPISLGDLEGNYFRIAARECDTEPRNLKKFRNLFGEQRFSKNNAEVGKAIIKKDFKKAAELVMENHGDNEMLVKHSLDENPNDYVGALRKIPLKILKMHVHAYQSLMWNRMAAESNQEEIEIIGFGTELTDKSKAILKSEGISQRDFIIKEIPELSSEGGMRKTFAEVSGLKIRKIDEKTYEFEFKLPKGSYATEMIKQAFSC